MNYSIEIESNIFNYNSVIPDPITAVKKQSAKQ